MSGSMIPVVPGTNAAIIPDADKVDIRRFCGYPAYGAGNAGFQSWRYFQTYGLLEFRLNNMTVDEVTALDGLLTSCRTIETGLPNASATLNVGVAAVFTRNPNELADRASLLRMWSLRLCAFMGIPPGPGLSRGVRMVV